MRTTKTGHGITVHVGGRHRPKENRTTHPHLFRSIREFLPKGVTSLPVAPDSFSYFASSKAAQSDILGNDVLGDCTATGVCHTVESVTGATSTPVVLERADAIKFYSLSTGYDPNNSAATDNGGDEVTVCTTWRDKGLDDNGAHAIVGWFSVDPTDAALVKSCAYLFETGYFGIELDSSWPSSVHGDGFVWDIGTPNPDDGHCVVAGGADATGLQINSWGFLGTITWAAIAQFCSDANGGNLFFILTREVIDRAKGKAPTGLDWDALEAAFTGQGGTLPAPPPAPAPTPAPDPTPTPDPTPDPAPTPPDPAPTPDPTPGPTC